MFRTGELILLSGVYIRGRVRKMFTFIESANVRNCKRQILRLDKKNSI